jgi:long-chain acyl-CoA synthetase
MSYSFRFVRHGASRQNARMFTLTSALDQARRLHALRTAIVDDAGRFTWAETAGRIARAAAVLGALGVRRGERFGVLCRNSFRHFELLHAGYWMGAVPVPVNYRLAPPEIAQILEDAGCRLLAAEDFFAELLEAAPLAPWRNGTLLVAPAPIADPRPQYEARLAAATPAPLHDAAEDDDAILLYTGGTTGRSKGVRLTHRNVISNGHQINSILRFAPGEVYLHVAPMFHSADLLASPFTFLGLTHAFLPQFSGRAVLEAIARYRVTMTMLAPTMIILALQEPDFGRHDLSSLKRLYYGSSPMAVEWIRRALERFSGAEVIQSYGLTETSPILTMLGMDEHRRALASGDFERLKSAGQPVPGVDLRIADENGAEVATGEVGEVMVRGPNVMRGYLNRPQETAQALRGGWLRTGDVGRVDAEGYLYLLDRKKDMVITGGENVYSSEVEAALYKHPKVHECAVIGVPDERYGEALLAVVVPAPGATLAEPELVAHCRGLIGGYKIPRRFAFVGELPKSAMGKILKTELRRLYARSAAAQAG